MARLPALVIHLVIHLSENSDGYGADGVYGGSRKALSRKQNHEFTIKTGRPRKLLDTEEVTCSIHVPPTI